MLSVAQFAALHGINKRTLHYYDEIGLFSPAYRTTSGYRYYAPRQNLEFEYIVMLKNLGFSNQEIIDYRSKPDPDKLDGLFTRNLDTIDARIRSLHRTRTVLRTLQRRLDVCSRLTHSEVQVVTLPETRIVRIPLDADQFDIDLIYTTARARWPHEQLQMGIGTYIDAQRIYDGDCNRYDGIYSLAVDDENGEQLPAGNYLQMLHRGNWSTLPDCYAQILEYCVHHRLRLAGCAYEIGLNEFALRSADDYVTCIRIRVERQQE
ncbi:MerR family transcriptional regulator [Bifidobacterium pseudolongum subsp. globosum]|uniref:MerR family transcriptional regulator n=1 Tax=Bifidobacterium pseudolongum subsp. globosum TaxID=1690 RepID=A0A2N3QLD1_9BIFI|nr:MerR family transcriptional regulator [Bifidobacterium pseudolongum]PKU92501.1 MerR family transcriptional regulator [Bifidobacterium pseudolongum subsp. globosum]